MTQLLTRAEVMERVNVSYTSLWQWMRDDKFPRAIRLSEEGQAVRWRADEVEDWINDRPRQTLKGDKQKKKGATKQKRHPKKECSNDSKSGLP